MKGMLEIAFLTSSRHGAAVKGDWSPIPTEDAMHAPDMETHRLVYDDGSSRSCRNVRLHIGQYYRVDEMFRAPTQ